ncbi:protein Z, vitamin K-dependent plasma glycoprotein a [Notolabrus celidotus]|uniref:protein Z, vitamin K-dependent plasma glycoprotein a n=1 Tax=Notolabrus celidotus TaxID=1203425 RepID=UPI00148F8216|nr:protein Z, vitamin K-dependent plasma glycoprotein a [Notolabrus celidotus]XP_034568041.1 protein Z, vitamin K-dependent plasma glycoprotein a [Notolabrus celidotus]
MSSLCTFAALLCLLAGAVTAIQIPQTVFLDKQHASSLISRQKRNVDGSNPAQPASLEQLCMEKVCTYEQARSVFQDSYRTDIFWSVYIDGDQCAEKPCKNGALCSDSVGGYDCVCKSGFSGVHCENDQTLCPLKKDEGCSQFCKPGYTSYECSCARGWKLTGTEKIKCIPTGPNPCGKVNSLSRWSERLAGNVGRNFEGLVCAYAECPWQALLKSPESAGFCSGVILKENLVLTSAQCANKYQSFQVAVGKRSTSVENGEQTLYVDLIHVHQGYIEGRPENDLAVIELRDRIQLKKDVISACLPEKDFADSILMSGEYPAMITGWKEPKESSAFEGSLTLNQLEYKPLPQCLEAHPNLMNNKMGCTAPRTNADCTLGSGSPLVTLYREVFFLTGVVNQPPGGDCTRGYIFQKVSRHLGWLQGLMSSR